METYIDDLKEWSVASRKRRYLAIYIDYLLIGVPWAIAIWTLVESFPYLLDISFPLRIVLFIALEIIMLKLIKWSPGFFCLGIVGNDRDISLAFDLFAKEESRFSVEPWLFSNERWWTILFGVLFILNGAKSMVRWTMWNTPMPFMGIELGATETLILKIISGGWEIILGIAVLRLSNITLPLGLGFFAVNFISTVLSWPLFNEWIQKETIARRAYQGIPVRPGEVEFMQNILPKFMIGYLIFFLMAICLVIYRIKKARLTG